MNIAKLRRISWSGWQPLMCRCLQEWSACWTSTRTRERTLLRTARRCWPKESHCGRW